MYKRSTDGLLQLMQTMNKSEKRQFSIHYSSAKTALLFDAINNNKPFHDPQLHNLKAALYKQLLTTIRSLPSAKTIEQKLHEGMEEAAILFEKQLYDQSYHLLQKVKQLATTYHQVSFRFQVASMEKRMAMMHVINIDFDILQTETAEIAEELDSIKRWSTLLLLVHGWYIRNGQAMNEKEKKHVDQLLEQVPPPVGFYAKLYSHQAKVYHAQICNAGNCIDLVKSWLNHFEEHPQMQQIEYMQYEKAKKIICQESIQPAEICRDTPESTEQYFLYAEYLVKKGLFSLALDYINPIINLRGFYRTDLQIHAREMQIVCHQKLGNTEIIDYLKKSISAFIKRRQMNI